MRRELLGLTVMLALLLSGCEEGAPPQNAQPPAQAVQQQQPAQQPAAQAQPAPRMAAPNTPIVQGSANQAAPGMVRQKAQRGMGKKGQGYGGGMITQPISTYFQTRDRIAFSVQIPKQMQMFKAMNNRNPKDLDEYINKIIKPAGIPLPELNEGERYVYDPEKGELLVERPQ